MDFVTYNGHYDTTTYVVFEFVFKPSGYVIKSLKIYSLRVEPYESGNDYARGAFEILFVIYTLYYTLVELNSLRMDILEKRSKIEGEN